MAREIEQLRSKMDCVKVSFDLHSFLNEAWEFSDLHFILFYSVYGSTKIKNGFDIKMCKKKNGSYANIIQVDLWAC